MKNKTIKPLAALMIFFFFFPVNTKATEYPELFQIILDVVDLEKSLDFFVNKLGLKLVEPKSYQAAQSAVFVRLSSGNGYLALHSSKSATTDVRLSFIVDDLTHSVELLKTRGLKLSERRSPAPGIYVVDTRDPAGNIIHIEWHEQPLFNSEKLKKGNEMLSSTNMITFINTANPQASRDFYEIKLGLEFLAEEPTALMFRANGRLLRISKVKEMPKAVGAVMGWEVENLVKSINKLKKVGVSTNYYEGLNQNENGVTTFPNGDKVAWFSDPDGNVLSLTQFNQVTKKD